MIRASLDGHTRILASCSYCLQLVCLREQWSLGVRPCEAAHRSVRADQSDEESSGVGAAALDWMRQDSRPGSGAACSGEQCHGRGGHGKVSFWVDFAAQVCQVGLVQNCLPKCTLVADACLCLYAALCS
jgi:hypothetical protein